MDSPSKLINTMEPLFDGIRSGHLVICGQTRYGKSTAALQFFLNDKLFDGRKWATHIFIDTKHDDELLQHGFFAKTIKDLDFYLNMKAKRVIYRPPGTSDRSRHLTDIINLLFEKRGKRRYKNCPYAVFIDEVQLYSSKGGKHEGLERLSTTGAGKQIHAIVIGQRLQDIHEQTLSQCNSRMVFFMQERPEYLRSRLMTDLIDWMDWLKENPYYFAFQTLASVDWQLHTPVPLPAKPIDPYDKRFAPPPSRRRLN